MTTVTPIGADLSLRVPETAETIRATCYRIENPGGPAFDLYVDADADDGISVPIREQNYALPPAFDLLQALTPQNGRVLDLGAHIGTFALFAAASGYGVVCVEASARNAVLLRASIEKNGFSDRVRVVEAAISNREGTLEFIQAGPYGLVANPSLDLPVTTVRSTTVSTILAEVRWDRVDFIKMDIEGSEVKGVQGMVPLLVAEDAPPLFYESNGGTLRYFGQTPYTLIGSLEALDYRCYRVHDKLLIPVDSSTVQPDVVIDILAIKQVPVGLDGWTVRDVGLTRKELVGLATEALGHPLEDNRAWAARAVGQGGTPLVFDQSLRQKLQGAADDPHPKVREAASWVPTGTAKLEPPGLINRVIARVGRRITK